MLENDSRLESSHPGSMFMLVQGTSDDYFPLTVRNRCHFDMVVGNVAIRMSFIQVAHSFQVKRAVSQLSHLTGV